MNDRVNPFAHIKEDPPVFTTKPRGDKPVEETAIAELAERNNFPSRQAGKSTKAERRKPRIYRTGRNIQFNAKVTAETMSKIYRLADEKEVTIGKLLELAVNALEREGAKS
jgi:hypothetical protein